MAGILYIVSTPIGNFEDLTFRALRILKEVDFIVTEDPRRTKQLLDYYAVETLLTTYHNLNKTEKTPIVVKRLLEGANVALVSDAGTPIIVDPGSYLVSQALASGIRIVPIPGPSAVLASFAASGLPGETFSFQGFAPIRSPARRRFLEKLRSEPNTIIVFVSQNQLRPMLEDICNVLGSRYLVVAKDLTTPYEEFIRGWSHEVLQVVIDRHIRGDLTLVIQGNTSPQGSVQRKRKMAEERDNKNDND